MTDHPQLTTRQLAAHIAEALGETEAQPLYRIRRIITVMGAEFVQELLRDTQAIEAAGGLFLERAQCRRMPDSP